MIQDNKILLIVNPISGTKDKRSDIEKMLMLLSDSGIDGEAIYTQRPKHAVELAVAGIGQGYETIVAVGGDGTVNEVASVLSDTNVKMGIIPYGSGNGLARHLNISMTPMKALQTIINGKCKPIDYCTVNGRKYFCVFGMGFDAAVAQDFALHNKRGLTNYLRSSIKVYGNYHPHSYQILVDDKILDESFEIVSACNASQYGNNAYIAPKAIIDDGKIDLVMVRPGSLKSNIVTGAKLFTGKIDNCDSIEYIQTGKIKIINKTTKSFPVHLDGEPMMMSGDLEISCHSSALKVIVP